MKIQAREIAGAYARLKGIDEVLGSDSIKAMHKRLTSMTPKEANLFRKRIRNNNRLLREILVAFGQCEIEVSIESIEDVG